MIVEPEPVEQRALRYLPTHDTNAPGLSPAVNHALIAITGARFSTVSSG
jgi:hypothetical protein